MKKKKKVIRHFNKEKGRLFTCLEVQLRETLSQSLYQAIIVKFQ